jgi:hypothetical protein
LTNQTPGQDQQQINAVSWTNGRGLVTGATIFSLLTAIVGTFYLYGPLAGSNTWTGANVYTGAVTFSGAAGQGVGNSLFTATGGAGAVSNADRATNYGQTLNAKSELNMACDGGGTSDEAALQLFLGLHQNFAGTVILPGPQKCMIGSGNHLLPPNASLRGINGGGLMLASGAPITANVLQWKSQADRISVEDVSFDANGNGPGGTGCSPSTKCSFGVFAFTVPAGTPTSGIGNLRFTGNNIYNLAPASSTSYTIDAFRSFAASNIFAEFNRCSFNSYTSYATKCFNIGGVTPPGGSLITIADVDVSHNFMTNSGVYVTDATERVTLEHNHCNGWGFGACLAAEPHAGDLDNTFKGITVIGNVAGHSANVPDSSGTGTPLRSYEIGYGGAVISGNTSTDTCGSGIFFFGANAVIADNTITLPGTCNLSILNNSGISLGAHLGGNAAQEVYIHGNNVDNAPAYGVAAINGAGNLSADIGPNHFNGALGPHFWGPTISGILYSAADSANLIVNPCATFNLRGSTVTANGKAADFWWANQSTAHGTYWTLDTQSAVQVDKCATSLRVTTTVQASPQADDFGWVYQPIIAGSLRAMNFGDAAALGGVYAKCLRTNLSTPWQTSLVIQTNALTFAHPITLSAGANITQCFSVVTPPETISGISSIDTNAGIRVGVAIGSGSTYLTSTPDQWVSGIFYGLTTDQPLQAQIVGTTVLDADSRFYPAAADNGWQPRPYTAQYAELIPFYRASFGFGIKPAANLGVANASCAVAPSAGAIPSLSLQFSPPLNIATNATPTVGTFNPSAVNVNWRNTTGGADIAVSVPAIGSAGGLTSKSLTVSASAGSASAGDIDCVGWFVDTNIQ